MQSITDFCKMQDDLKLMKFIEESNRIEGLYDIDPGEQLETYKHVLKCKRITVKTLQNFVTAIQPKAVLRDQEGLDVYVGLHEPISGGPEVTKQLKDLLRRINKRDETKAWIHHVEYENIHPFTDGNGRSGRLLWLWEMGGVGHLSLTFLHQFYYQTLDAQRIENKQLKKIS